MSSKALVLVDVLMAMVGVVWVFQGTGYLGGSFMTGRSEWTWIGAAKAAIGAALLLWQAFAGRNLTSWQGDGFARLRPLPKLMRPRGVG